jgi:DNA gyrase/topoisomerase IV subunit A
MKKLLWALISIVVVAAGSFIAGFWPEHQKRAEAEKSLAETRIQIQGLEAQLRMWVLEDRLLAIRERITEKNFGLAREQASTFFEEARIEATRTTREDYRAALNELQAKRDAITADLAMGEARVSMMLYEGLERMRTALGRPRLTFMEAPATPPAAPAAPPVATPAS